MNSFPLLVEKLMFCLFFDLKLVKYAVGIVISKLFCLNSLFNIIKSLSVHLY